MKNILKSLRHNWLTILLILVAIALRLKLSFGTVDGDLLVQYEWGKTANSFNSLKGFYDWDIWGKAYPNHPPLISSFYYILHPLHKWLMWFFASFGNFIAFNRLAPTKFIWFFNFSTWFGNALYSTTPKLAGVLFLQKQFMIFADLGIAAIIFYLCKIAKSNWKIPVLIYLFFPFTWYLSSAWGQSDQLSFLFLLISSIFLFSKKYFIFSPLLYAIAANLKPTCIFFIPIYIYSLYKQKISPKKITIGFTIAILFSLWTISWFTNNNPIVYSFTNLIKKLNTSDGFINYNAFNFWYIFYPFIGGKSPLDTTKILIFTAKNWGLIFSIVSILTSLFIIKNKKIDGFFTAMFISGFGCCSFMTGIHERYYLLGVIPLFLLSIYRKKYWKYFLLIAFIYSINLVHAFLYLENLSWIRELIKNNNFLVGRLLSVINIILYFKITKSLLKEK